MSLNSHQKTEEFYQALLEKDSSYKGVFFAAVKTTGVFCHPICTARKPKKENVEFYSSTHEAIVRGYRPCKICKPLDNPDAPPDFIKAILEEKSRNPTVRLKDADLRSKGFEPHQVRRWFLKNYNLTFHSYQRMLCVNSAFKKIRGGESVISAAFESGYESLSGFNASFKTIVGASPSKTVNNGVIDLTRLETPLGSMIAGATERGICLLKFSDEPKLKKHLETLAESLNASIIQGTNKYFHSLERQLIEYFSKKRRKFTIPLVLGGTSFQRTVWNELQEIPFGVSRTLLEQAETLGRADDLEAVSAANTANRIRIIIPDHRITETKTAYSAVITKRKQWLLQFEQNV